MPSRQRGVRRPRRPGAFDPSDIFAALNRARVRYLVVGGVAAIFHGVPRTTFDADIALQLDIENLSRLDAIMSRMKFAPSVPVSILGLADPRIRRQWVEEKNMKVFSYKELRRPFRVLDVMVRPLKDFDRLHRQRVNKKHRGVVFPLIPIPGLVRMKTGTGRAKDHEDIEHLRIIEWKTRGRTST